MKKRWTGREIALMSLPCVALAILAWWTRDKNLHTENFEFTLQSVEVVTATPRDVYEGFDTVVRVKYDWPSAPKIANATPSAIVSGCLEPWLTSKVRNKTQRVKTAKGVIRRMVIHGSESRVEFRLKLSKVPLKHGELTLRSAITGKWWYNVAGRGGKISVRDVAPRSLPISVVVRKAGKLVTVPQVSKHRPFVIQSIGFDALMSQRRDGTKTIQLVLENLEPTDKDNWRFLRSRLVDERGREYEDSIKVGKQYVSWVQISEPADHLVDKQNPARWFSFPLHLIPSSAGKLTFKTEVSLNDGWPLPVSYIVRP